MKGGTLIVSRSVNLLPHYKDCLEKLDFKNVYVTSLDKYALNTFIKDLEPEIVIIQAQFYYSVTPYMVSLLLKQFKGLYVAVVSMSQYPPDLGMWFINNGVKSYVSYLDGRDQFFQGIKCIKNKEEFISASVLNRLELRQELPKAARKLTDRQIEIMRLVCCGFTDDRIADTLYLSSRTVDAHKRDIYLALNVRNGNELIRAALTLEIVKMEEIYFYPDNLSVQPRPDKKLIQRGKK